MSGLIGRELGSYQLIEEIDDTGETLVYKAFQPGMNRYVAIKVLKPSSAHDAVKVEKFLRQGELIANIQNPRILNVIESGQVEGMYFRALRLAENYSIREHRDWFFDPRSALALFGEIVEGLEVIHAQGFVHGNLKPSNILLDSERHVLLTDFGYPSIATVGATTLYLAPEQYQGGVVDRRADVYALGVLLFETLVGQSPPPGAVVSAQAQRADLPQAVDQVIYKSMAQNPDQRFQHPIEFFNALQTALTAPVPQPIYPIPTPVAPTPSVSQTVTVQNEGKRGSNWLAIVIGIVVIIGLCIGAYFLYQIYAGDQDSTPDAPTQPVEQIPEAPPIVILPSQPPAITQVLPTREPRPTRPPLELPTRPSDQMPQIEQPIYLPPDEGSQGGNISELPICNSTGAIGSALLVGGVFVSICRQKGRRT